MSASIFKYPLPVQGEQVIRMPAAASILSLQVQNGVACMWALIDTAHLPTDRTFRIYGTGERFAADALRDLSYVGTFQLYDGAFVGHVFEVKQK